MRLNKSTPLKQQLKRMKTEKVALLFLAFSLMISSEAECAMSGSSVPTVRLVFTDFKTYFRWLYIIFYKGLYITRTFFFWQMLANHMAHGRRSIIKTYSFRLHIEDSIRTLMLLLWQLLIEMLGLFCEST